VLVTDVHERGLVATCRGLAAAGFRVAAATHTRLAPALWSRACSERLLIPDPLADEDGFIAALRAHLASGAYAVLIPASDQALELVSARRAELEAHTRIGLPAHAVVQRALNKRQLGEHAQAVGLSPPETVLCESSEEALHAAAQLSYPVLVKPERVVERAPAAARRHASKLVRSRGELAAMMDGRPGPVLVQRYVAGTLMAYAGVRAGGRVVARVASRYSRTWRPDAGHASFSESFAPPPDLATRTDALLDRLEWHGMFQLQLLARVDGSFSALDFNPRPYGSMALALKAGVNIPAIWCRFLLGTNGAAADADVGVSYRWEDGDFRHLLWMLARRRYREASRVLRPRRRTTHAYFAATDPLPLAARLIGAITGGRATRRARAR
jgi:predicted ATP-grasp superfamily ATP-dependent carboligase